MVRNMLLGVISLGCAKEIPNQVGNNVTLTTTVSLSDTARNTNGRSLL